MFVLELARVIGEDQAGLVGKRTFGDVVPTPKLGGIYADFVRGGIDHAFNGIGGLGPARATIGAGRVGVGEDGR